LLVAPAGFRCAVLAVRRLRGGICLFSVRIGPLDSADQLGYRLACRDFRNQQRLRRPRIAGAADGAHDRCRRSSYFARESIASDERFYGIIRRIGFFRSRLGACAVSVSPRPGGGASAENSPAERARLKPHLLSSARCQSAPELLHYPQAAAVRGGSTTGVRQSHAEHGCF